MAEVILGYTYFLPSWSMKAFDDTLARVERFNQPQANAGQVMLIQKPEDLPELPHDQIYLLKKTNSFFIAVYHGLYNN